MRSDTTPQASLPAPIPLRPSRPQLLTALNFLFEREYEFISVWQNQMCGSFTDEIQTSVGQALKKCLREYSAVSRTDEELGKQKFVEVRDVLITTREVSGRINQHKAWLASLNHDRLDAMIILYARVPHHVLREVMELNNIVRAFVSELSSAMEKNNGVPWPLSRREDCSDITPSLVEELIKELVDLS